MGKSMFRALSRAAPSLTPRIGSLRYIRAVREREAKSSSLQDSFELVSVHRPAADNQKKSHRMIGERVVVPEGEQWAFWDRSGAISFIDGPRSRMVFGGASMPLSPIAASPAEFIATTKANGESEIIPGPAVMTPHPIEHQMVSVYKALEINTNEAVVVYTNDKDGGVARQVVRGPSLYTPRTTDEWTHEFAWHGADWHAVRELGINRKVIGGLQFKKLRLVPDQLYFDVEKVRTKDDALLTVKVMVFHQLEDVEKMVNATHDPVSDKINSLTADVIDMVSGLTFEEFRASTDRLNCRESYTTLTNAAEKIGYSVDKVVFRGYEASNKLQQMHDQAIETRTEMRLTTESEEQQQNLHDFRQDKEQERALRERQEEERTKHHLLHMENLEQEAKLNDWQRDTRAKLAAEREEEEQKQALSQQQASLQLEAQKQHLRAYEDHYERLDELGVDLTQHLSQKADKVIRLEAPAGNPMPQLHMNE